MGPFADRGGASFMSSKVEDVFEYDEAIAAFDPVMGLEVHVELNTNSKMFCGCPTEFGGDPNTHVCPVCLGLPGALPVVNGKAVESAIRIGLALNCEIAEWCRFARKNYFYPDMPKNFQTSQYDEPICFNGYLDVDVETDEGMKKFRVEIERAHMEEDTGKASHQGGATGRIHGADYSLLDYNRAGIPLIEIVTKPIVGAGRFAPEVARAYVSALRDLLRALGVSDVRMEQGSLRCDVNLSLRKTPKDKFGTRTETKNVNSLRSVERAVRYEITRQASAIDAGKTIIQETRHWHEDTGVTTSGRIKEEAEDYRYFPEPDLVPIAPSREWVEELRKTLPENPSLRKNRLQAEWGITDHDMASVINAGALDLVLATIDAGVDQNGARKWWLGELARLAKEMSIELIDLPITAQHLSQVEKLIADGKLNDKLARVVIEAVINGEGDIDSIIEKRGLAVVSDDSSLLNAIDEALAASPDIAAKIKEGKLQAAGAIVGAVMKTTKGQADAAKVRALLFEKLGVTEESE
jgi:aspartyl-tRNA(Asn)/glutamyl-tRNA(Gln) amidotransferase subunit B